MSVLNFSVVRPSPDDDDNGGAVEPDIIKSKDPLVLHCAFRRYRVRPIFSASTRHSSTTDSEGRANKFERFLKPGAAAVATVFAPLVATGTFLDVEPRRIVAKRVVLTGAPFKVHKRICTVRYMFFNPDDVLWFKPVQVHTKHGRVGHIRESLGTHGYMKCLFDGPITQQDVVPEVERALGSEGPDGEVQRHSRGAAALPAGNTPNDEPRRFQGASEDTQADHGRSLQRYGGARLTIAPLTEDNWRSWKANRF
ncbi:MAG: hypothetical protein BJ554DRAFT_5347 [Olpidium bornovanus]|uniref:Ribosome biogenesis protein BMS1/TSR1 C-terminal domain-containing protein n=1 Tax=Olpidium bornovanus TaxID=278681 RepID=A0A8H7ZZT4_9FUNG|nr:MAG: hypothetical protein BJ554DRAFT_5347 [Olpidium bornovanus]